jgi:hypothetical protein
MEVKVSAAHGDSYSHLPRILRGEVAHVHMVGDGDSFYMREKVPSSLDRSFQNLVSWASEPLAYHTPLETILSRSRTKRTALRSLYTGSSITMMRVFNLLELFLNGSLKNNTSIVPVWLSKYSNKFYIYCFFTPDCYETYVPSYYSPIKNSDLSSSSTSVFISLCVQTNNNTVIKYTLFFHIILIYLLYYIL